MADRRAGWPACRLTQSPARAREVSEGVSEHVSVFTCCFHGYNGWIRWLFTKLISQKTNLHKVCRCRNQSISESSRESLSQNCGGCQRGSTQQRWSHGSPPAPSRRLPLSEPSARADPSPTSIGSICMRCRCGEVPHILCVFSYDNVDRKRITDSLRSTSPGTISTCISPEALRCVSLLLRSFSSDTIVNSPAGRVLDFLPHKRVILSRISDPFDFDDHLTETWYHPFPSLCSRSVFLHLAMHRVTSILL